MLKKYCGDVIIWTYASPPYVTISHHFRVPPPPSLGGALFEQPLISLQKSDDIVHTVKFVGVSKWKTAIGLESETT